MPARNSGGRPRLILEQLEQRYCAAGRSSSSGCWLLASTLTCSGAHPLTGRLGPTAGPRLRDRLRPLEPLRQRLRSALARSLDVAIPSARSFSWMAGPIPLMTVRSSETTCCATSGSRPAPCWVALRVRSFACSGGLALSFGTHQKSRSIQRLKISFHITSTVPKERPALNAVDHVIVRVAVRFECPPVSYALVVPGESEVESGLDATAASRGVPHWRSGDQRTLATRGQGLLSCVAGVCPQIGGHVTCANLRSIGPGWSPPAASC
jgi:hypothetical protein